MQVKVKQKKVVSRYEEDKNNIVNVQLNKYNKEPNVIIVIPRLLRIRRKECHETVKMQHAPLSTLLPNHQDRPTSLSATECTILIRPHNAAWYGFKDAAAAARPPQTGSTRSANMGGEQPPRSSRLSLRQT